MFRACALALLVAVATASPALFDRDLDGPWDGFKQVHQKMYGSEMEENMRRLIWEDNVRYIQQHNLQADLGMHTYWTGLNQLADMTLDEFRAAMNGLLPRNATSNAPVFEAIEDRDVPDTVDWRTKGYVTGVKNQGQCGSCWSFSTTGSLEGQHFKKTGKLVSLSEQNLVDCSKKFGNHGCQGGLMDNAFKYIKENGGIDTEESYPYHAKNGRCHFKKEDIGATCTGFVDIKKGDEDALKQAVGTVGPVSIAIDASHRSFQMYKRGVYSEPECSSTRLDHGVLAVGYGTEGSEDYWLVKNSWGAEWGMQGYINMSRNKRNQCGVATAASYPTV